MSDHSNSEIPNGSYYVDVAVLAKIFAKRYGTSVNAAYEWLTKDVEVPFEDVQPVVHGEWTSENACPFCGFQPWFERDIHSLSFCPNCGAKMDKRKGEDNVPDQ